MTNRFSTDLLKDESSEIDLVSPTLPALKALLNLPSGDKDRYSGLVHALLSATLLNIDAMRYVFYSFSRIPWTQ